MTVSASVPNNPLFLATWRGSLRSTLRWPDWDALRETLSVQATGWYLYAVGEPPPTGPVSAEHLIRFLAEVDALLRAEHDEDYCGIVYADDFSVPNLVKIYDPNNLGVSCGSSDSPPLPGWVLSRHAPVDLQALRPTAARRRWWQRLFATSRS